LVPRIVPGWQRVNSPNAGPEELTPFAGKCIDNPITIWDNSSSDANRECGHCAPPLRKAETHKLRKGDGKRQEPSKCRRCARPQGSADADSAPGTVRFGLGLRRLARIQSVAANFRRPFQDAGDDWDGFPGALPLADFRCPLRDRRGRMPVHCGLGIEEFEPPSSQRCALPLSPPGEGGLCTADCEVVARLDGGFCFAKLLRLGRCPQPRSF
jgi:hypothetical protein